MNKLMGFYELKALSLPTVKWSEFTPETNLNDSILWTIRTALYKGNDYNLPRLVGVTAKEAYNEGVKIYQRIKDNGLCICYPYFIADVSGTVRIEQQRTIIEAVMGDLWNLVTDGKRDITVIVDNNEREVSGDEAFLAKEEDEILNYAKLLRGKYRRDLAEGREIYLEWSYAYDCSVNKEPKGQRYIIFYEMRIA
ncbi:hypothetical protein OXPF_33420 [Oxobacter pfennigii]|uniref:Uncharacterized protein n=1 Tax=Oxobacter pfennigii TaxID=36849 RepID=A0A0P8W3D1_9CLOT|nr:hypothetical protein [Oxobacter pfennigii]KPU43092.1 hypothetical protein OXPF_33420 [Oxobacter pfennigii]